MQSIWNWHLFFLFILFVIFNNSYLKKNYCTLIWITCSSRALHKNDHNVINIGWRRFTVNSLYFHKLCTFKFKIHHQLARSQTWENQPAESAGAPPIVSTTPRSTPPPTANNTITNTITLTSNGSRKSAFLPYKPNSSTVLTNLQRGNTEANVDNEITLTFHERAGQGEITEDQTRAEAIGAAGGIDAVDPESDCTALHWASYYGQLNAVMLLIKYGADVNRLAPDLASPLLMAAAGGHHEVVKCLLNHGANAQHMDIVIAN